MWRRSALAVLIGSMLLGAVTVPAAADGDRDRSSHRGKPSRVLIIMLDQARPDTIERYDMDNVKELMRRGTSFPNALVGHMAAETVISHNVITSSQFPKNMGWSNEVHRDVDGVLGTPGDYYVTSSLTCDQFKALIERGGYKKLPDYLDDRFGPASKFVSIAQKRTAVCPAGPTSSVADGNPTDPEDIIFQIRGSGGAACDPAYAASGWREPEYANGGFSAAPLYLNLFPCSRWSTWQGSPAYGTGTILPGRIYPLEGDRFVPGRHDVHVGGDNWSADAAIRVIEADPAWRGMLVSLGGIDKLGHMWGPEDEGEPGALPGSDAEMRHLPFVAKNADLQVGRIVHALKAKHLLDDTLIVITADHAAQTGREFHGVFEGFPPPNGIGCSTGGLRSDCNWYFGRDADETYLDPSPAIAGFRDALTPPGGVTNLDFSYQDGHVAAWLDDTSRAKKLQAADAALDLPGVIASYWLDDDQDDYRLFGTNRMSRTERKWFERHGGELVDTMAAPYGPDVTALLETDVTYGVMGDHGGHNRLIQNIPMIFSGPGVGSKDSGKEIRLVDVMPTILETMGIRYDKRDIDGRAVRLSGGDRD
jgi:Type I phosphodiesterase / nucleotide pyrophosphatase